MLYCIFVCCIALPPLLSAAIFGNVSSIMLTMYCTVLYCIVLCSIVLYCSSISAKRRYLRQRIVHHVEDILYCVLSYCIVFYSILLYCNVLYCIVFYYTVLCSIVLYCSSSSAKRRHLRQRVVHHAEDVPRVGRAA